VQQFGQDILPLLLLFAISVTGLMLTARYPWMKGYAHDFLASLHGALLSATSIPAAAKQCGIAERTLRRWMSDDPSSASSRPRRDMWCSNKASIGFRRSARLVHTETEELLFSWDLTAPPRAITTTRIRPLP